MREGSSTNGSINQVKLSQIVLLSALWVKLVLKSAKLYAFQYLRNYFGEYIFQKQNPLFVKSTVCQKRFCPRCSYGTKAKWYTHNNTTPHVIERDGLAKQPKFSPSIQSSSSTDHCKKKFSTLQQQLWKCQNQEFFFVVQQNFLSVRKKSSNLPVIHTQHAKSNI